MRGMRFSLGSMGPAVKGLLAANGAVFVLQRVFSGWFEQIFGLVPVKVWSGLRVWQMGTYLFLHGSFFHILFNMFALWMFGKEIERQWGSKEFLKFYFLCGFGAAFLNVCVEPFSALPVIGASGAIYGLLVAFAIVFPDAVIYLYGIFPMRAVHFVLLLGGIEFLASFNGSHSMIARFAHLGGMATGYLYLKSYEFRSFVGRVYRKIFDSLMIRKKTSKKTHLKVFQQEDLVQEVNRILEKVLVQGVESLTDQEKEVMRRYSSRKH